MSWINVLAAVDQATAVAIKQNFTLVDPDDPESGFIRNDFTNAERKKLKQYSRGNYWKVPNLGGTNYFVISWHIPFKLEDPNVDDSLAWINHLESKWPGKFIIIGAWNNNGAQYGWDVAPPEYDENGDRIETPPEVGMVWSDTHNFWHTTDNAIYPLHAQYMKIMPDDVVYDENGDEISRTPASAPKEVHNIIGWTPRIWV